MVTTSLIFWSNGYKQVSEMPIFIGIDDLLTYMFMISGCVSQKESMIKQGYPFAYADGFDDGCHRLKGIDTHGLEKLK